MLRACSTRGPWCMNAKICSAIWNLEMKQSPLGLATLTVLKSWRWLLVYSIYIRPLLRLNSAHCFPSSVIYENCWHLIEHLVTLEKVSSCNAIPEMEALWKHWDESVKHIFHSHEYKLSETGNNDESFANPDSLSVIIEVAEMSWI